jgi:hypothetical protein
MFHAPRAGEDSRGALLLGERPARPVVFVENGVRFESDVVMGQKTGFFLDQRDNRKRMQVGGCRRGGLPGHLPIWPWKTTISNGVMRMIQLAALQASSRICPSPWSRP